MKKYIAIAKITISESLTYKIHFICSVIGNLIYIGIVYYIWRSIYYNTATLNPKDFMGTFISLSLADILFTTFRTLIDSQIANHFIKGELAVIQTKPLAYPLRMFFINIAMVLTNTAFVFIPTFLFLSFISSGEILYSRLLFFIPAFILAFSISFLIDFITSIIVFYTHNIWGMRMIKDAIIIFTAGVTIPLQFYPKVIQKVINILPFHTIYYSLGNILVNPDADILLIYLNQICWLLCLIIISAMLFKSMYKKISINGG